MEKRFWKKVLKSPKCWEWTGASSGRGYGVLRVEGKNIYSHRLSYELHNGKIPEGNYIDHICGNKSCVRPSHLQSVTPRENTYRYWKKHKKSGLPVGVYKTESGRFRAFRFVDGKSVWSVLRDTPEDAYQDYLSLS